MFLIRCNVCGKEFFEKALFRRHVKKATHGKKGRVKQNLERECEHCGRKFTQLREYRRHMNNHQGELTQTRIQNRSLLDVPLRQKDNENVQKHLHIHCNEVIVFYDFMKILWICIIEMLQLYMCPPPGVS